MKRLGPILFISAVVCVSCTHEDNKKLSPTEDVLRPSLPPTSSVGLPQTAPTVDAAPAGKCPADMVEVEGDFCPNVDQTCIKVDKSIHNVNGYAKCDEFAPTKCLSKQRVHMHFCMDRYEWPNKKEARPLVMLTWNDMKRECGQIGKRICVDHEWSLACEGPEILPYPYGLVRDATACNIDHPQKPDANINNMSKENVEYLWQGVSSGSMERCVSPYGVHDMTGNVDESVVNSEGNPYHSAEMGGHWVKGARNRCRPKTTIHNEDFAFYEIGGRCCKDIK